MKKYWVNKKFHKENISFYGVMIFVFFAVLFSASFPHMERRLNNEQCIVLNKQWSYVDEFGVESKVDLPIYLKPNIENGIRISTTLPKKSDSNVGTIGIFTTFQYITAYLEDEMVYSYQPQMRLEPNYGKVEGSSWHVMRLPNDWNGKKFVLEITSPYEDYRGAVKNIFLGTKASFLFEILRLYGGGLLLAFWIIITGILLLVTYAFIYKLLKGDRGIAYLGWFQIWVGLWIFSQSSLTQFFISNERIVQLLSFVSLMILPIPLLLYLYNRKNVRWKNMFLMQAWVHVIETVVVTLLQFASVKDFYETLIYTHIVLIITIIMIVGISTYEKVVNKNDEVNLILFCGLVLGGSGIFELICFYEVNRFHLGKIFNLGIAICIIASIVKAVQQTHQVIQLSTEAQYYEKLATLDYMTGCQNRTAYLQELQRKNSTLMRDDKIAVVIGDLNHLKFINDRLGHNAGDNAIRLCALLMLDHLGELGTCYRIGGDEFVCLIYNHGEAILKEKLDKIRAICERESQEWGYDFAIAMGYSFYDYNIDRDLEAVIQRADELMYQTKHQMKTC